MIRAVVIVNPAAGGGRTARVWRRLRDVMAATLPVDHAETRGPDDATRLAREAVAAGARLVISVGGDGTLNEVINGVRSAGTPAAVGAVLTGRGADACRNFGVPRDPFAAVRALADGRDARFDLGRAEWSDGRCRWFASAAGAGFDAAVAARARTSTLCGTLPYLVAALTTVWRQRPTDVVLECDDGAPRSIAVTAVIAANGRCFGGGMRIAPAADPADARLDVVVVGALGRLELLRWLPTMYRGAHVRHPRVRVRRARWVRLAGAALPTHIDGEPAAPTPVRFTVEPGALRLRVPSGA